VSLVGRLSREPEIRYLREGVAVYRLDIAIKRSGKSPLTGLREEEMDLFDVLRYRCLAKTVVLSPTGSRC
jgi:single-stranded DNA-binding protein